jgi:gamma-glutamylcyclotransferase
MYELTEQDVHNLNRYEGDQYQRQTIPIELINKEDLQSKNTVDSLVYVDVERKSESLPKKEYVYRMNMAIADALQEGVPSDYIDKYLRPFIPSSDT